MKVIYPGSFDPVTFGHLDIIKRCVEKFGHVIVAVLDNQSKKETFTISERVDLLKKTTKDLGNVEIDTFSGLLADYVEKKQCTTLVRGLRAVSDFEYEMQMALVNRKLNKDIETLFMIPKTDYVYLSSSIVREVASYNGNISCFVPKIVEDALNEKYEGGI
ncbi:MAG TPA: pantetheine-phosphate adenylyltransferase [Tissierellaceae bacterium]|nr:pantetheine-phosphate adenylyltransferase [Tissierellaceae bacterium]